MSPVKCISLSPDHLSENLHLLLPQMFETGLDQSHLLTPYLQKKETWESLTALNAKDKILLMIQQHSFTTFSSLSS